MYRSTQSLCTPFFPQALCCECILISTLPTLDYFPSIQPPGVIHQVYSPERSIYKGGHFFMLESMHLTEVARACAAYNSQKAINASHPGCLRLFCRMAIALVFQPDHSGRK